MLAAVEAGLPVVEYTPAEIKRAVVGYGRAEKHQVQQMVKLLLGLDGRARRRTTPPTRWPSRSATCTSGRSRRARRRRVRARAELRGRPAGVDQSWRHVPARPGPRDRAPPRPHAREASEPRHRRRRRRRLRRAGAALDLLRARRARRRRSRCASTRTCARTRSRSTGSRTALEQELFERLIARQRHRPEAGARRAVGHRAARS